MAFLIINQIVIINTINNNIILGGLTWNYKITLKELESFLHKLGYLQK
jgi:hypothetical protein